MAKPTTIKIRLNSTADTGHFYVAKKNARTMTDKMVVKKSDASPSAASPAGARDPKPETGQI